METLPILTSIACELGQLTRENPLLCFDNLVSLTTCLRNSTYMYVLNSTQIKQVQGGGDEGTRVRHAETSATGRVTRFFVDEVDGYNGFDIQWDKCDKPSRYTTREVLEGAERYGGDQCATSPAKDDERVLLFLRAVLCMVNVQVRRFLVVDDTKFKRKYNPVALAPDVAKEMMSIREIAWDTIQKAKLTDTMTESEKFILGEADGKLLEEVGCTGSLLEALGLGPFVTSDDTGFVSSAYTFHERQMTFVNHFVRGAQASWKLGRPTSLESCIAPLSAGAAVGVTSRGEVNELRTRGTCPTMSGRGRSAQSGLSR